MFHTHTKEVTKVLCITWYLAFWKLWENDQFWNSIVTKISRIYSYSNVITNLVLFTFVTSVLRYLSSEISQMILYKYLQYFCWFWFRAPFV